MANLPGVCLYRTGARTGWPSISIFQLGEVETFSYFYPSVAANTTVCANPSLRCAKMLLGHQAISHQVIPLPHIHQCVFAVYVKPFCVKYYSGFYSQFVKQRLVAEKKNWQTIPAYIPLPWEVKWPLAAETEVQFEKKNMDQWHPITTQLKRLKFWKLESWVLWTDSKVCHGGTKSNHA